MLAFIAIIIVIIFPKPRRAREFVWGGVADRPGLAGKRWDKWRESGVTWLCGKWSLHFKCSPGRPEASWKGRQVPSTILEQQIGLLSFCPPTSYLI